MNGTSSYEPLSVTTIAFVLIELLLMLWICIGNGLVIFVFLKSAKLNSSPSSAFIINLAVSDFLVGIFMALHIAMYLHSEMLQDVHVCILRYVTLFLTQSASVNGLLALTYDRYYAINWPLHYTAQMSRCRISALIGTAWLVAFGLGFVLPLLWHNEIAISPTGAECDLAIVLKSELLLYIAFPCFVLCSAVMVYLYVCIFSIARKHAKCISKDSSEKESFKSKMKLTKTGVVVLGVFLGCWLPFFVIMSVQLFSGIRNDPRLTNSRTCSSLLAVCNSGLNPIIYALRIPIFRQEIGSFLKANRNQVGVST